MTTFLLVFFILSSLVGWTMFILEVRLSKAKDGVIDAYQKESKSASIAVEALRSQNARLIQTVAMLHRGIEVDKKRIEEFKLEEGR